MWNHTKNKTPVLNEEIIVFYNGIQYFAKLEYDSDYGLVWYLSCLDQYIKFKVIYYWMYPINNPDEYETKESFIKRVFKIFK